MMASFLRCTAIAALSLLIAGCNSYETRPSIALEGPLQGPLIDPMKEALDEHPGLTGFRLLANGEDAFLARAALARGAQHSLDIQYYIVHDGITTRLLIAQVLSAADRGVRVRILIDDTASDYDEYQIATLSAHPNIEVRLFNPLHLGRIPGSARNVGRLLDLAQQHRRMHNKVWLADNTFAIVGGRNLGDEYFDATPGVNFTDLDLLSVGPVSQQLGSSFDEYWNHSLSTPIENLRLIPPTSGDLLTLRKQMNNFLNDRRVKHSIFNQMQQDDSLYQRFRPWADHMIWAPGMAVWDDPGKVLNHDHDLSMLMSTRMEQIFTKAEHELILVSAYFVPGESGTRYLTQRADEGVAISVMTNSLEATDVPAVHGGYSPYRQELLEHGIKLYELRARPERGHASWGVGASSASLHTKALIVDGRQAFIGSLNLDPRSVLWNTEVGVVVDNPQLASQVRDIARDGMALGNSYEVQLYHDSNGEPQLVWLDQHHGKKKVLSNEPGGLWRKINAWLARRIGLEHLL